MQIIITSTDKDVTILQKSEMVYAKNQVQFKVNNNAVLLFTVFKDLFESKIEDIIVNGEQLTAVNAKALLSYALFRKASGGDIPGPGGDSNWEQVTW